MADLAALAVQLSLDAGNFQKGVDQAITQMGKMEARSRSVDAQIKSFGKSLAAVVSVGTVVAGFNRIVGAMDDMSKAAQKTGVAAEDLQRLAHAADMAGVPFETLQVSLRKLSVGMLSIGDSSSEVGEALRKLGVSAGSNVGEAIGTIADRFAKMPDGAQKTAEAIKLFGKTGADLIPLLNSGSAGLKEMADEADRLGIVMSADILASAEAFNDNLSRMNKAVGGVGKSLVAGMLPALNAVANAMVESARASDTWKEIGSGLGQIFAFAAARAVELGGAVLAIGKGIGALAAVIVNPTQAKTIFKQWVADVDELDAKTKATVARLKADLAAPPAVAKKDYQPPKPLFGKAEEVAARDAKKATDEFWKSLIEAARRQEAFANAVADTVPVLNEAEQAMLRQITNYKSVNDEIRARLHAAEAETQRINQLTELLFSEDAATRQLAASILGLNEAMSKTPSVDAEVALRIKRAQEETDRIERLTEMLFSEDAAVRQVAASLLHLNEVTGQAPAKVFDMQKAMQNLAEQGIGGLADAIVNADRSFKEFAANFLKQIAKMIIQQQLLNALKGSSIGKLLGFSKGGAFSSSIGLPYGVYDQPTYFNVNRPGQHRFAMGGVFGNAVLGEAGAEAIVPLRRTASGDLGVKSSPVNVNVFNNTNAQVSVEKDGDNINIVIERVRNALTRDVRSGGNAFAGALQATYGLNRAHA